VRTARGIEGAWGRARGYLCQQAEDRPRPPDRPVMGARPMDQAEKSGHLNEMLQRGSMTITEQKTLSSLPGRDGFECQDRASLYLYGII